MKFTTAWSQTLSENNILKVSLLVMLCVVVALAIGLVNLALEPALIVERACYSKPLAPATNEHTQTEIEAFAKVVLSQRFDTDAVPNPAMIAASELASRALEQKEMLSRRMTQRVTVNEVTVKGQAAAVNADRLISVRDIRSAFMFPLDLQLGSTDRSDANPYGLVLLRVSPAKPEASK